MMELKLMKMTAGKRMKRKMVQKIRKPKAKKT
jgi:hypothetical protein